MSAALLAHVWQSTLCALPAWGMAVALRGHSARARYFVWLAASLKFLIPFSALTTLGLALRPAASSGIDLIPASLLSAALSIAQPPLAATVLAPSADALYGTSLDSVILVVWSLGSAAFFTCWLIRWLRIRKLVGAAVPHWMNIPIEVKVSASFTEPGVFGIFDPVLLMPKDVISRTSPAELSAVVAHEMCHVRRRDNLAAAAHMIVLGIFWFHPLLWWIGKRLLEERENACDEAVIELGAAPRVYAEGIVKACRISLESRLGLVAGASGANLNERIEAILENRPTKPLGALANAGLLALACAILVLPLSAGLASPREPGRGLDMRGELFMRTISLRKLVSIAYGTTEDRVVGGPYWLDDRYDIGAAMDGVSDEKAGTFSDRQRQMIQRLLHERFKLSFVEYRTGNPN